MQSLFRSFERSGLRYLLISGQASVLYGAATFSEDIDIWIQPSSVNVRRLFQALARNHAHIHKLTPALTPRNISKGHGFHFVVPGPSVPTYLDVLGRPPRVGPFKDALNRSCIMSTPWGKIPVVGIEDLVALKKTRRLADYEVISNLVRLRLSREHDPSRSLLRWAAQNSFRAEDRSKFLRQLGKPTSVHRSRVEIARDLTDLQERDSRYWSIRINDLRHLRRSGALLIEGTLVKALL